jgi:proteasome lid subunit RPN8/RPN11
MDNPLTIWIRDDHWEKMCQDVKMRAPLEACGIVAGINRRSKCVFIAENVLRSPTRFRLDPHEQLHIFNFLEKEKWDFLAIYHSHPQGPVHPSPTDLREAAYPETAQLIWSPIGDNWSCRAFFIRGERANEIQLSRFFTAK